MMGKNVFQQERFKVVLLLLLLVIFGAKGSALSKDGPMDQLQRSVGEILKILQSAELKVPEKNAVRKQLILSVVTEMFDFQEMAKSSLGKNWSSISTAEQDKFVDLFTRLVEQRYIGKIDAYNNQEVVYKKERVQGNKAIIYTDIVDKDLEIPIDYRLKEKQGKWLIYDLKIENVSLVANYRRDFDSIIRKEQFAGLVEKITKQIEKSKTSD